MDINELLCVGRSRTSQSKTERSDRTQSGPEHSNRTLSRVGLYTEEPILNSEVWSKCNKSSPRERVEDYKTSDMYASGYLTPPKKSILRGRPVSPKLSSPSSSMRSVRFSDKERKDESIFAKLHVNEITQTDHGNIHAKHNERRSVTRGKTRYDDDLDLSDSQQIKTSTPRSNVCDTQSLEFLSPRRVDDRQTKMLSNSPKASEQKHHRDKLIIDIDITPKSGTKQTKQVAKDAMGGMSDGQRIIQNMSLNEQTKHWEKNQIPDGNKITQNMDLHHLGFSSAGTQTVSAASSPRSASPETPYSKRCMPDGSKIIRNMELGTFIRMKSESVQTIDMDIPEPEPKTKSISVQATDESIFDALSEPEDEKCRSISLQTDLDSSDISVESDEAGSRSIATQTRNQTSPDIPDGTRITKNMDLHKSPTPKGNETVRNVKLQSSTLNDNNWNEFVKHLEMFNPSPSISDSETEDEIPITLTREPVIVYDSHEHANTVKIDCEPKRQSTKESSVAAHRESRSAKKLLESEEFTRQQYESVLSEDKFLQKLKSSYTRPSKGSTETKPKHEHHKSNTTKITSSHHSQTKKAETTSTSAAASLSRSYKQGSETCRPTSSIQTLVYRDDSTECDNDLQGKDVSGSQRRSSMDSLTFTPIETYSFKPETLAKAKASNSIALSQLTRTSTSRDASPKADKCLSSSVTESVTKNSFIQGVDLGPIPTRDSEGTKFDNYYSGRDVDKKSNTTGYVSSSHSASRSLSPKRYMKPTLSSQASSRSYCFSPSRNESAYSYPMSTTSSKNLQSSSLSTRRSRPSSSTSSRIRGHPLSSSLREMRNTAVRKSAMSSILDPRRKSSYDYGSSKSSTTNRASSTGLGSFSQRYGTNYKSYEDYDRFTYAGSRTSASSFPSYTKSYKDTEFTQRSSTTKTPNEYMNALNDISNARLERSLSRSRSRSPKDESMRRSYDNTDGFSSRYTFEHPNPSVQADKVDESSLNVNEKDEGFVQSVSTSRAHAHRPIHATANLEINREQENASKQERQSRGLSRKPPLPVRSRSSRSRSSSANGITGSQERVKHSPVVKEKRKQEDFESQKIKRKTSSKRDKSGDRSGVTEGGTISIGHIPPHLVDKACMYLGHETIQKIINEAKL